MDNNKHDDVHIGDTDDEEEDENVEEEDVKLQEAQVQIFEICSFTERGHRYNIVQVGCFCGDGVGVGMLVVPADPGSTKKPVCTTCRNSAGHCVHTSACTGKS